MSWAKGRERKRERESVRVREREDIGRLTEENPTKEWNGIV